MERYFAYLLECADGTLYAGWTTDPVRREAAHNAGKGAKYTRSRRPVRMVYRERLGSRREAMQRERALKQMTRSQKWNLIAEYQGAGEMKEVTAAIAVRDGRVLVMRRAPGQSSAGGWEFPGGKVEPGESAEDCLARELREELGVTATVGAFFRESRHEKIDLLSFRVAFSGDPRLTVHDKLLWADAGELLALDLLPADRPIAQALAPELASPAINQPD